MSDLPRDEELVELLQDVPGLVGHKLHRLRVVLVQPLNDATDGFLNRVIPVVQVPGEQIAFEEVSDTERTENSTVLKFCQLFLQDSGVKLLPIGERKSRNVFECIESDNLI